MSKFAGFEKKRYWPLLVLAWITTLVLGHWGFVLYFREQDQAKTFVDIAYLDLQLYKLSGGSVSGRVPLPLNIARIAAPAIAAITLLRVIYLFLGDRVREWKIRRLRDHIVVCGAGEVGFHIAASAQAAGHRVVVIDRENASPFLGKWIARGGHYLLGDATEPAILRAAALRRSRAIIAACDDDGMNVKVVVAARRTLKETARKDPLACYVQILDYDLSTLFRASPLFHEASDTLEIHVMNAYETAARIASQRHPIDRERMAPDDPRAPQLVLLGFGRMGMALALQYAKVTHVANGKRLEIAVFDRSAAAREKTLHARFPGFKDICTLRFHECSFDDANAIDEIRRIALRPDALTTVALCLSVDSQSLAYALSLQTALRGAGVPILVRMAANDGLAALLGDGTNRQLMPFGTLDEVCDWRAINTEQIDALAKEVHRLYQQKRTTEGSAEPPAWRLLDPELQDSCRQQADHIAVKLRATGCVIDSSGDGAAFEFHPDEMEMLSRMEHRRWVAERVLAGWQAGPKDTVRKRTPYLVEYDVLDEAIKDYDRDAVRNAPKLIAMTGGRIRRV